ncbi:MAG TPA: hypothetical protein VFB38_13560 [Chthonomonadaceae bacterium]|nr:hypothetical protein [Chthonomonadaceae bacterium]
MKRIVLSSVSLALILAGALLSKPASADSVSLSALPSSGTVPLDVTLTNAVTWSYPNQTWNGYTLYYSYNGGTFNRWVQRTFNPPRTSGSATVYIFITVTQVATLPLREGKR